MNKLFSYVLRFDDGAAPNPFGGICTLTICKPAIRRSASVGDWIIGTGSKNSRLKDGKIYDLSDTIVYAMKVSEKQTLSEYDFHCQHKLKSKIPKWHSKIFQRRIGDCIYDFTTKNVVEIRQSVHNEWNKSRDLSGKFSLLSDHFYYFGETARSLPLELRTIIKRNQGHRTIEQIDLISKFEEWISQFEANKIYGDPQLKFEFEKVPKFELRIRCSQRHFDDDILNENDENIDC